MRSGPHGDFFGTPATAIDALIRALAAFVTLHVIRKRQAQLVTIAQPQISARARGCPSARCYT
jgi:hypothetical protein